MPGALGCWFEQVAVEFERVVKHVPARPDAHRTAAGLAQPAEAIRAESGCDGKPKGGRRAGCVDAKGD